MKVSESKTWFKTHQVAILYTGAVILGLICGFILRNTTTLSPLAMSYIQLPGQLMIRYCSMFIVPLIVVALATSLGTVKTEGNNKRMISATLSMIIVLSIFVSIFGIIMVCLIQPGAGGGFSNNPDDTPQTGEKKRSNEDSLFDILMNIVPDNIISSTFMMEFTVLVPKNPQNISMGYNKEKDRTFKTNVMGLCVFSLILGFVILDLGDKVKITKKILEETNIIIMRILRSFIVIMPIGMFFWMLEVAFKMQSPQAVVYNVVWFTFTALLSFIIIWFVIYPGIYFFALRANPFRLYYNIMPALMVALGSASSTISLPITMKSMEENQKLSTTVSKFVLPLAMNMHMPGTSLYYPMVVLFVAQMHGIQFSFLAMIPLAIYIILLVMALPAAAGGGLFFFLIACDFIGVQNPMNVLIYCIYMEWLMERIRTATNVMGDCIIASIVQKYIDKNPEQANDEKVMEVI